MVRAMVFTDLKLVSRARPFTAERLEAAVGTDCQIRDKDRTGYVWYTITSAEPTDDPYKLPSR